MLSMSNKMRHIIQNSLFIKLLQDSYQLKIRHLRVKIFIVLAISFLLAIPFIFLNNTYEYLEKLFSSLSNIYSILIGFNISSVVFIVSFLFKEIELLKKTAPYKLELYYKQIVNSFMLSTIINLSIIILGIIHISIVKLFSFYIYPRLIDYTLITYGIDLVYFAIWIFLIISSLIVFCRCLVTLTLLLRIGSVDLVNSKDEKEKNAHR